MPSAIIAQLDTYGPDRCEAMSAEDAAEYTRRLVRQQYENFSVLSFLVPARLRDDFANIYAFCRWADDLGDETGDPARSLELLAWWRRELARCYEGRPRHPVFVALLPTIRKHDIPADPFEHLIDAFEQDQRVHRYESWEQVLDYCTRSADPVGRLVLYVCGYRDEQRQRLSDSTCTALQLVNFWQDVRRDIIERDRIYVPADALAEHGLTHDHLTAHVKGETPLTSEQHAAYRATVRGLVDRTWPLFRAGHALPPMLSAEARTPIRLFSMGGEAIMRKIEKMSYATIDARPRLSKAAKTMLMLRAMAGRIGGGA